MAKKSGMMRALVGLALLMSVVLSACGPLRQAGAAPNEEPEVPFVETGEGVFVDSVETLILESWPVQVKAVIRGNLADGCTVLEDILVDRDEAANRFEITIVTSRDSEAMCTMALVPFEETVSLDVDGLPAGTYTVEAHGVSATFSLDADNEMVEDPVGQGAYIDSVEVVMGTDPMWPQVVIRGDLADGCTQIVDTMIVYQEETEIFTITVGTYRDPDAMCTMALVPFEEAVGLNLEGLAAGTYMVEVHGVSTTFEVK